MHYYPHHIGDFIRDTANLTDAQSMAYLRMIWKYYTDEAPLSDSCERIAFAVRSDAQTVRLILEHYFTETTEGWRHGRCDEVISGIYTKSEKARESAKHRWKNANASGNDANALPTHSERNANEPKNDATQYPIPNTQIKTKIKNKARTPSAPAQIDFSSWPNEPSQPVFDEWTAHRKRKKAAITPLVIQQHGKQLHEAARNGWTVDECLMQVVARNWQGLEASWLPQRRNGTGPPNGAKPSAADDFREKRYQGTPDDELPEFLRSGRERPPEEGGLVS